MTQPSETPLKRVHTCTSPWLIVTRQRVKLCTRLLHTLCSVQLPRPPVQNASAHLIALKLRD
jgi:hypothetical protein